MPVAIVAFSDGWSLHIVSGGTDEDVLLGLLGISGMPQSLTQDQARAWLSDLPLPSGWYNSFEDAQARLVQLSRDDPLSGSDMAKIRGQLGQTRAEFALALGFKGSSNTRHKQIWEMENDRKPILPERARAARVLLARARLQDLVQPFG